MFFDSIEEVDIIRKEHITMKSTMLTFTLVETVNMRN